MTDDNQSAAANWHCRSLPHADGPSSREFRDALGLYASGITVIAGHDGTEPLGFTCQSFYSVSLEPPLVSFSVMVNSSTYPRIRKIGKFSVNILSSDQQLISSQLARKGSGKWSGISWTMTGHQNPTIEGALASLDCRISFEHRAGDHFIVIGEVLRIHESRESKGEPLVYFRGRYRSLGEMYGSPA